MGGSSQTQETRAEPWGPTQGHLTRGLNDLGNLYNAGGMRVDPYTGQRVANQPSQMRGSLNQAQGLASQATNAGHQARHQLLDVATTQGTSPQLSQAVQNMSRFGVDQSLLNAGRGVANAPLVSQPLSGGISRVQNYSSAPLNRAVAEAQGAGPSQALTDGVNRAGGIQNTNEFNRTVNDMTSGDYDERLRQDLIDGTMESVMPAVNATFAGAGMTGSGLHQAQLTQSLGRAIAPVEAQFLDRLQDRQFAAANASNDANFRNAGMSLDAGRAMDNANLQFAGLDLQAGGMADSAGARNANMALGAGQVAQGAQDARHGMRLDAGQAVNNAWLDRGNAQVQNAARLSADEVARQGVRASAASAIPGVYNPALAANQGVNDMATRQWQADQLPIQGAMDQYYEGQTADIDAINNYLAMTSGLGSAFGTQTSTSRNNPGMLEIIGAGASGLGMLGMGGII